ncbi:hypothetical protein R3P38DRAFT_2800058 [Favolaschia claudopus]|uniref:Uncharacterized protein n=1 Tax=Favolaschia claudopus TaxID=2862362 RepID=A0AAV9ZZ13_9AGAR
MPEQRETASSGKVAEQGIKQALDAEADLALEGIYADASAAEAKRDDAPEHAQSGLVYELHVSSPVRSWCGVTGGKFSTTPSLARRSLKRFSKILTPPTTPQRHQQRQRQIQREIRESNEASPRRRRVPAQHDENTPPDSASTISARSLGQLNRHQRARENRPPPPLPQAPSKRSLAQRARRERERAEKAARMDVDPPPNTRNSRVLQAS